MVSSVSRVDLLSGKSDRGFKLLQCSAHTGRRWLTPTTTVPWPTSTQRSASRPPLIYHYIYSTSWVDVYTVLSHVSHCSVLIACAGHNDTRSSQNVHYIELEAGLIIRERAQQYTNTCHATQPIIMSMTTSSSLKRPNSLLHYLSEQQASPKRRKATVESEESESETINYVYV